MAGSSEDFGSFNTRQERVILNCGGVKHETFLRTLQNFPDTRLTWSVENRANNPDYDPEKNEFFFDRHPGVFAQILNFYRTGKLHAPHDVCGPLFQDELTYWAIDEKQMEPCCWSFYTQHREAQESLKAFEGIDGSDNESDDELGNSGGWTQDHSSKWQTYKVQIWNMFENHRSSKMAKTVFALSLIFIIISVIAYILQTLPSINKSKDAKLTLSVIELICGVWFTVEFTLRLIVCPNKKNFFKEPMNWIDLIAILPVFVRIIENRETYPQDVPSLEYDILAAVRLFRLFRFFKVNLGFLILKQTMIASSRELLLLILLVLIPVIIFATFAYIFEKKSNKDFGSIPDGLWWAIITITTVGYGDSSPITLAGKIFGSICALVSIIITALPISIIGSNFSLYYSHAQAKMKLPKKSKKTLIGAANALMVQSTRRSDEISVEEIPINDSGKPHEGMNGSADGSHRPHNIRRARRARSSLYTGGVVPVRMSLPTRARSNEDIGEDETSPPEHRKKSYTSTQTTTIDTPPKSPTHFGNTLTVSHSDVSENILDMSCPDFGDTRIVHNEVDEFCLDEIDRAVAKVEGSEQKEKTNGFPRPGTPVKKTVKHSVRFVKPTLTVTALTQETGNVNDAFVEELKEESQDEQSQNIPILNPPPGRPTSPVCEDIRGTGDKGGAVNVFHRGRR